MDDIADHHQTHLLNVMYLDSVVVTYFTCNNISNFQKIVVQSVQKNKNKKKFVY